MNSLRVIMGFIRKEFRIILRSRELMIALFALPVVQLLLLGFAVTNEVKNVTICFFDRDRSPQSRELINSFLSTDRFVIVPLAATDTPESVLNSWKAKICITIPTDFGQDLTSLRVPSLQVLSDGIDGNSASIANSLVLAVTRSYLEKYLAQLDPTVMSRMSGSATQTELIPRMLYNPDLKSNVQIIPGIIAILVTVTSMMFSALSSVREKELGTLEQLLVTPVSKWQLLAGKVFPTLVFTFFQLLFTMLFARIIFGTQVAGSLGVLLGFAGVYIFATIGLGIFISVLVNSQQQAMFFAWFVMVISIMLSGFFIPIHNMPHAIKVFTFFNPMRHFVTVVREIVIKGTTFRELLGEFITICLMGITLFSGSVISFRKRV